ncbi:MAG: GFA family protein [Devosia sp.]
MPRRTELTCRCGKVHVTVEAEPMIVAECECNSCRQGAAFLATLPGAGTVTEVSGGTHYVLYRKDRVSFTAGAQYLLGYRLTGKSHTRRVVAACCNTPIFVEFKQGHWLSLYGKLWPAATRPPATLRTMMSDLPAGTVLPGDIPGYRTQSVGFFWALLTAWAAMGFRVPKVAVAEERVIADGA